MNKSKIFKRAGLFVAASLLSLSQAVQAEINISGWVNEGVILYDDGQDEEAVQATDNGTTLATRITFAGSTDTSFGKAGFEIILEPRAAVTPLIFSNQDNFPASTGHVIGVLGNSIHLSGAFGKLTVGLQSMPTDNIAVLEDPSLTLWSGISPVFRGNGFFIRNTDASSERTGEEMTDVFGEAAVTAVDAVPAVPDDPATPANEYVAAVPAVAARAAVDLNGNGTMTDMIPLVADLGGDGTTRWGDFLNCFTAGLRGAAGIGIDCNGIYRQGVRYDLPTFGPVSVAVGWANESVYDISAKYKGQMGRISTQLALGYATNTDATSAEGHYDGADNFQFQFGLMDPITGLFGSFAFQKEDADLTGVDLNDHVPYLRATVAVPAGMGNAAIAAGDQINFTNPGELSDDSTAWWLKVGIKKEWSSIGATSFAFDYGLYEDQYGFEQALNGVTGSEVQRIGFSVDQYFGSNLIVYFKWERLELDVDTVPQGFTASQLQALNVSQAGAGAAAAALGIDLSGPTGYGGGDDLDTFTLGFTYFF